MLKLNGGEIVHTLDDVEVQGKMVFVRVDINCPVDEKTGIVQMSERIAGHAETIRELAEKGAKVVVLAHQGREGDPDFVPLKQHAALLEREVGLPIKFVPDIVGDVARRALQKEEDGDIILLDNVRFLKDETKPKTIEDAKKCKLVQALYPYCNIFVHDAFSAAHRKHASLVGFVGRPIVAGRVMERELKSLKRVSDDGEKPVVFILGGAKVDDSIQVMEHWLKQGRMDYALTGGLLGNLFLAASGNRLGASERDLREEGALAYLERAKELLKKYPDKIRIPKDVALSSGRGRREERGLDQLPSNNPVYDLGAETIEDYIEIIRKSKTAVLNGPMGVYERVGFGYGTEEIMRAMTEIEGFTLMGGGHTLAALERFHLDKSKINYISLAGKALISYLTGEEMPGVEVLEHESGWES